MRMLSNTHFGLNANQHKLVYVIISAFAVMLFSSISPPQAQAWTGSNPNICAGTALSGFNYVDEITQAYPDWQVQTISRSILIYDFDAGGGHTGTAFRIADNINFVQDASGNKSITYSSPTQNTAGWPYYDNPIGTSDDGYYIDNFYFTTNNADANRYHNLNRWNTTGVNNSSFFPKTSHTPTTFCIVAGINVNYSTNWTGTRYPSLAPDNGLIAPTCNISWWKVWEKANCKANEAFTAIGDTISEAAKDIANGVTTAFAWMFIPDEQEVNDLVGATGTFFEEKLGFILFPFDFVIDLFAVFTDPPDDWCSTSSCTISAGTVFGAGNLQINVLAIKNASEAAWTLLTTLARIGLVLALIAGIHRKYEEVTQK